MKYKTPKHITESSPDSEAARLSLSGAAFGYKVVPDPGINIP